MFGFERSSERIRAGMVKYFPRFKNSEIATKKCIDSRIHCMFETGKADLIRLQAIGDLIPYSSSSGDKLRHSNDSPQWNGLYILSRVQNDIVPSVLPLLMTRVLTFITKSSRRDVQNEARIATVP
jgi:hypothetical protein